MKRDWFFWIAITMATLAVLITVNLYIQRAPMVEVRLTELNSFQERQLELFRERVAVLLTVTTLVIGGAGAFLLHFHEGGLGSVAQQRWAILSLLTGGLSVFFATSRGSGLES